MRARGPSATGAEIIVLAVMALWAAFPIALLLAYASHFHASFTGADGLIGADGVLGADQLQYLAWIRDAGSHILASNLFSLSPSGHVYLEPLFTVSGLLWHLGLSLQLSYLIWKPIAVVVLVLAAIDFARRAFGEEGAARAAAVVLALFLFTPLDALFSWSGLASDQFRFQIYLLGDELFAASKLWGYVPSALALALVPTALLAAERALDPFQGTSPGHRALTRRINRGALLACALAAGFAAWLHPWQGITLIVIFVVVALWQRFEGGLVLIVPAIAAGLPLLYYYWLEHSDPAWRLARHFEVTTHLSAITLLAGLGPLAVIAALGWHRPGRDVFEQSLLVWIPACFVSFAVTGGASHALQGLSFPVAVLAVRGGQRMRIPTALGAVVLLLFTVPGMIYVARKFIRTADQPHVQYYLTSSDERALQWVAGVPAREGVLAPTPFAAVIPGQTGHRVWVGHGYWSLRYPQRAQQADALFGGRLRGRRPLALVRSTGASILVSDCGHRHNLTGVLSPILASVHTFGCARVYTIARRS
jgi:hypothetical protein